MKFLLVLLVVASQLGGAGTALGQAPGSALPDVIQFPRDKGIDNAPPVWVSATAAADRDHVLNYDLIGDTSEDSYLHSVVRELAKELGSGATNDTTVAEVSASECITYTVNSAFGHITAPASSTGSLESLAANSVGVYVGTVTARTPGFLSGAGTPSTIASVSVTKTLRAATAQALSSIYLLSPIAHFRIGSYIFCSEDMQAPAELQVGDQVTVFVYKWLGDGSVPLTVPQADQLLVLSKQGLRVGPSLSADTRLVVCGREVPRGLASPCRRVPSTVDEAAARWGKPRGCGTGIKAWTRSSGPGVLARRSDGPGWSVCV